MKCEICHKETEYNNGLPFLTFIEDMWACQKCAKPMRRIEYDRERSNDHGARCACHACQRMFEYGYRRKANNNQWIKIPLQICGSFVEGVCDGCSHSKKHFENQFCCHNNPDAGCNRTLACADASQPFHYT